MGGYTGIGNIELEPQYLGESFLLDPASPCVDAGNPLVLFNDLEDPANPGNALFPSRGTLLNDMGAYGGPLAAIMPFFETITGVSDEECTISEGLCYPNPSAGIFRIKGNGEVVIVDPRGQVVFSARVNSEQVNLSTLPEGMYVVRVKDGKSWIADKLILSR